MRLTFGEFQHFSTALPIEEFLQKNADTFLPPNCEFIGAPSRSYFGKDSKIGTIRFLFWSYRNKGMGNASCRIFFYATKPYKPGTGFSIVTLKDEDLYAIDPIKGCSNAILNRLPKAADGKEEAWRKECRKFNDMRELVKPPRVYTRGFLL